MQARVTELANNTPGKAHKLLLAARPYRHIFLLSHMRAYSSLFGHILGSHPQICGYYEMHIGYHSWKSLVRQKLLYFSEEPAKPRLRFMFDKVLHNDHDMRPAVLANQRVQAIIALRRPAQTLPSILRLYQSVDPDHPFNDPDFATQYYIGRLRELGRLANTMQRDFFYLDAESMVDNTADTLSQLGEWLKLEAPLSAEYEIQRKTSQERFGDTSDQLRAGTVQPRQRRVLDSEFPASLVARANEAYESVRRDILEAKHCAISVVAPS